MLQQEFYTPVFEGTDATGRKWEIQLDSRCKLWKREVWYRLHCRFVDADALLNGYVPFYPGKRRRTFLLDSNKRWVCGGKERRAAEALCPELLSLVLDLAVAHGNLDYATEVARREEQEQQTECQAELEELSLTWSPPDT